MRWVAAGVLVLGLAALPLRATTGAPSLDRLFAAYVAGDRDVAARSLLRAQDFPAASSLDKMLVRWRRDWQPARVAFLLDVAIAGSTVLPNEQLEELLASAAAFVRARPQAPVESARSDRIEATFHRAALGLIEQRKDGSAIEAYVDAMERQTTTDGRAVLDPRALLARAIARADCCLAPDPTADAPAIERIGDALQQFDRAAAFPETRAEALVRGAYLLLHEGRPLQALARLDRFGSRDPDDVVTYWADLIRGRILDALDRHADAERAYRAAFDACPAGQSAGVGLALDLLRLGRAADAESIAATVRTGPAGALDPWWAFDEADARFVPAWRDDLRKAMQ